PSNGILSTHSTKLSGFRVSNCAACSRARIGGNEVAFSPRGEMAATNRARPIEAEKETAREKLATAAPAPMPVPLPDLATVPSRVRSVRVSPPLTPGRPRQFVRVPTHAVGVSPEQREYPRASLRLPLRLRSVNGVAEEFPVTLVTRDISSTGVFFLCPKE